MLSSTVERVEKELGHLWSPKNEKSIQDIADVNNKVLWRCEKGHDYEQVVRTALENAKRGKVFCLVCTNRKALTGFNDLASRFPDLAKEYSKDNPIPADKIVFGSNKKVKWVCAKNESHTWLAVVQDRSTKGKGCKKCFSNARAGNDRGVTFLSDIPELLKEYSSNNSTPADKISYGSKKKVQWICSNDSSHVWYARVDHRTNFKNPRGCPQCSLVQQSSKGENELFTFVSSLLPGVDIVRNDRKLLTSRKELDIYIPELGIAFEFNGLYWHSLNNVGNDKNYHYNKFKDAKDNNVQLFTIWSCDWDERKSLVKRLVKQVILNAVNMRNNNDDKTGSMNDKTVSSFEVIVKTVTTSAAQDFHNKHNSNLFINKGIHYALFDNDNIVRAILTVDKEDNDMKIHNIAFSSVSKKKQLLALKTLLSHAHNESMFSQCKQVTACVSNDFLGNVFLLEKLGFRFSGYRGARKISTPKFTSREISSNESSDDNCKEIIYDCGMSIYSSNKNMKSLLVLLG